MVNFAQILKGAPIGNHNASKRVPTSNGNEQWDVDHKGKGYEVTFQYHTGHAVIAGSRTSIVPSTASSIKPQYRTSRTTVDPSSPTGKAVLGHIKEARTKQGIKSDFENRTGSRSLPHNLAD